MSDGPLSQVSLVLWGGYEEERLVGKYVKFRQLRPGQLNFLRGNTFHRLSKLPHGRSWSLFLTGPKTKEWHFRLANGTLVPWREFIMRKGLIPLGETRGVVDISPRDAELLRGEPAPLTVLVPVEIED